MSDAVSSENLALPSSIEPMSWIERARRMVSYYQEATDFIKRASKAFPVSAEHARILMQLWVEADLLDSVILPLLDEMNTDLIDGQGELETKRGVSVQRSDSAALSGTNAEEVVYECFWSLDWTEKKGISVVLSVVEDGVFYVQSRGNASAYEHRVGYPVSIAALQDALVATFVAESTYL